jgi:hypothetical protein
MPLIRDQPMPGNPKWLAAQIAGGSIPAVVFAFRPRTSPPCLRVYFGAHHIQVFPQLQVAIVDLLPIDLIDFYVLPLHE